MADVEGDFIAYDLLTTDPMKSGAFYESVLGWTIQKPQVVDPDRKIERRAVTSADGHTIAGIMSLADDDTTSPGWLGYIAVTDVDATVAAIEASAGKLHVPPMSVDGVGRFAMVADPQGVVFYVMRREDDRAATGFSLDDAGRCSWNELATTDRQSAFEFYTNLLGWADGGVMPMGPAGDYQFLSQNGSAIGAIMTRADGMPAQWLFYFRVADIDAALAKVEGKGGTVVHGPAEVPGGDSILVCLDPTGAGFGLVGKRG